MPNAIYLDYNASAPLKPEARDVTAAALGISGNPSSVHQSGREARAIIERARQDVAILVGGQAQDVIFTSGATEANNLAIRGFVPEGEPRRIIVNVTEHPSVLEAVNDAEHVPVRPDGVVDIAFLQRMLADRDWRNCLISVMAVNNETGVIQPIDEVVSVAHAAGAKVHCDAVQAAGHMPIDMLERGIDIVTISAHKMGGPRGAGAVITGPGVDLNAILRGGGQERGKRSGTENVSGIAGMGAVCASAPSYAENTAKAKALRDRLETELRAIVPAAVIVAANSPRVGHVCCVALPGVPAETQVMAMDLEGIAVSAGAACSSGKIKRSHVLSEMGLGDEISGSAIRVSFGWNSADGDVDAFLQAYQRMASRIGG
ncbi:cysteine desulfurase family protein [Hwanghaeella sp.]|uniref:cysteine desulfurase family protein n=1 Tax=Hwanghaeella sp. TaxID=2605943 RepID=UPI003CCBD962